MSERVALKPRRPKLTGKQRTIKLLKNVLKQRIVHSFHSEGVVAPIIEPFIGIPTIAFTNIKHSINPMLTRL